MGGWNSATDAVPQISISPDELSSTQYVGEIVRKPLIISNDGPASLTYSVAIGRPAGAALLMHLDEPAGATVFDDSSGNNYAGSCSGAACPTAGVVGRFGTALRFDGSNDYVKIGSPVPAGLQVQNELSLVAWIYVTSYPPAYTLGTIVGCQYDPTRSGYALHLDGRTNPDGQPSPPGHLHFQIEDGSLHTTNANAQVPLNQWVHVAAVRKANENARIYYNGVLQPSTSVPWTGGITYSGAELDLGRESDYGNRFFNGMIDEVAIYNRALSAQEVEALYQAGSGGSHVSWLSADPSAGTVAGHTSAPVQVTFDATDMQPGAYQTMLFVQSNDPVTPLVSVPVSMGVVPDADMGWVEGTVTDAVSGNPVAATIVALGQPYTVLAKPDGTYKLWLDAGSYTLQVSAANYATQTAVVSIAAQQGTSEDFALELNIPRLKVWPESLAVTHQVGDVTMRTLTIRNDGPASLTYSVAIGRPAGAALLMHLDEPAGATVFDDSSGNNHAGSCSGAACPTAGVVGRFGTALRFDGSNDYVKIGSPVPAGLQVQNELSLVAWIYVTSYPPAYTLGTIVGCQYDPTRSGYALHLDGRTNPDGQPSPPGHLHFQIEDGSLHTTNANAQVPLNQWVHVAAVRKANENARIYYNGVLQPSTSVPWTGGITYSGAELDLGRESDYGNRFFNGVIDEVAIYNRALSAQEVEALYQAGSGGSHVSWLSADPSAGTVAGHTSAPVQVTFDATDMQPGAYQTMLFVQSNDLVTPWVSVPVNMTVVPDAEADGPYTITEGGSVTLNGTSAYVPGPGDTLTYAWDLDNDGVYGETGADAARGNETGDTPTFSATGLDGPGSVTVSLRVTDRVV